ncbi:MAG TPA: 50S ribosomal protein L11 methyltransferase [Alphaproteobacteria bacterium]|nr:50S ribosomal protein L11 methyltransferase [Alphaproteobacteria bacterium]
MHSPLWVVELEVPRAAGAVFADLLGGLADDFSCFESEGGASWRFAAYLERPPAEGELAARIALAAAAVGIAPPALTLGPLPARDWLAENRRQFPPVRAGRFFVHGTAFAGRVPPGCVALALDAGLAFGSGEHASTRGCLLALDRLWHRRRRVARSLDLGGGAGILASQAAGVLAAYRGQGLALARRITLGEWVTLVLGKSGAPRRRRAPPRRRARLRT